MTTPRYFARPASAAVMTALAAFIVYLLTLSRSVSFIDAGELATAAWTLGVTHPTGYPVFTLVGWLFAHLPIAGEVIVRLNIMAAFWCSAGLVFFYLFVHDILAMLVAKNVIRAIRSEATRESLVRVASMSATLLLAFSETYWSQAVAVEVYSLHLFFVNLLLFLFLRACIGIGKPRWLAFAFVLGLSFANHMTTILLAPGFLYLYFATQGGKAPAWRRIGMISPAFLLGLSPYIVIPLRAAASPVMNWGNAVTLERFLWHVSGKQYRVWIFSSTEAAGKQFAYFLSSLPAEFAYVGLILAPIGAVMLWRAHRKLAIASILLFLGCIGYSINYDIHDIDSYFLLAYLCMAFWSAAGLLWIAAEVVARQSRAAGSVPVVMLLVGMSTLMLHYTKNDESQDFLVEDYTHNMFASLAPGALVLSYQWDYWVSASFYYQTVDGERPDVTVIDKELLRRSWYIESLRKAHPDLMHKSAFEVDLFLRELDKFEHDRPYNPQLIEARYTAMIESFIGKNIGERPVYVTGEIEPQYTRGYQRVPSGLAFRLYPDRLSHPVEVPNFAYRQFPRRGRLEDMVKKLYADATNAAVLYSKNPAK